VQDDDRGLVRRCLDGDQDACTALVDRFARMVGTVIWRVTGDQRVIEDLAQETFLRVFRGLPYFDARAKLSTWTFTIAHRVAVDHLRQAGRWREDLAAADPDEVLARMPAGAADPEASLARDELDRLVREELGELPDKYRVPVLYAALDGLDYETIGAMLGVQPGTVKTLVFRGKQMLKRRMTDALNARCRA
jgi:RNA polymerase sigma-70 factor (ECF subfamily)